MKKYILVISYVLPVLFVIYVSISFGYFKAAHLRIGFGVAEIVYLTTIFFGYRFLVATASRYRREVRRGLLVESNFTRGMYIAVSVIMLLIGVCYLMI